MTAARIVGLDVETSGLDPRVHDVLEVGVSEYPDAETMFSCGFVSGIEYGTVVRDTAFNTLVIAMADRSALEVNRMLERRSKATDCRPFAAVAERLERDLRSDGGPTIVVGKNPGFDLMMLQATSLRLLNRRLNIPHRALDLTSLAYAFLPGAALNGPSTEWIGQQLRIDNPHPHMARYDARWAVECVHAFVMRGDLRWPL